MIYYIYIQMLGSLVLQVYIVLYTHFLFNKNGLLFFFKMRQCDKSEFNFFAVDTVWTSFGEITFTIHKVSLIPTFSLFMFSLTIFVRGKYLLNISLLILYGIGDKFFRYYSLQRDSTTK